MPPITAISSTAMTCFPNQGGIRRQRSFIVILTGHDFFYLRDMRTSSVPSMQALGVIMEEGQPEREPCGIRIGGAFVIAALELDARTSSHFDGWLRSVVLQ